jgi:hypothetical protein
MGLVLLQAIWHPFSASLDPVVDPVGGGGGGSARCAAYGAGLGHAAQQRAYAGDFGPGAGGCDAAAAALCHILCADVLQTSLAPGGIEGLRSGHETLRRWALDRPTPMEARRILDPKVDQRQIAETIARARALFPDLHRVPVTASWAGYIDSTPDGVPAIGETAELPGLMLAAGFSGHGFGIGPGAGHLIADLVTGDSPLVDPLPYHPARFARSAWGKVAEF